VRPIRLLDTTAFRLTLIYLSLFGVSALMLFGYLYLATAGFMTQQTEETIQAEIEGLAEQYYNQGARGLQRVLTSRSDAQPNRASIYLLIDPSGRKIAGNLDRWPPEAIESGEGWLTFEVAVRPDGETIENRRAVAQRFWLTGPAGRFHLLVGREVEERLQLQTRIKRALSWGLGLTLLLGLAGGLLMSRGLLRRVDNINRTTEQIMAGDLSQRITLKGARGDEFDQLAANLNAMLEQIERLLNGMRQVTDNIAHDLRTPLNRMRSRIEVALLAEDSDEPLRPIMEQTLKDAESMIATFNALLDIARAEAGSERAAFSDVDLAVLTRDIVELYQPLAEDKNQTLTMTLAPGATVPANRHLLSQALANLLDNAIKYTPKSGKIAVTVTDGLTITVADSGPGIAPDNREKVLDRFTRLDETRATSGNGLGLSLVNAVAKLHGARLVLDDNQPGLDVRLEFKQPAMANMPKPKKRQTGQPDNQAAFPKLTDTLQAD